MRGNNPLDRIDLPPLYRFYRPFWAYDYLGWSLLREHLFGQSWRLMEGLDAIGDEPITASQLSNLLDEAHTPPAVRSKIVGELKGQPASELVALYRSWEDEVFDSYVAREQDLENRMLGKVI